MKENDFLLFDIKPKAACTALPDMCHCPLKGSPTALLQTCQPLEFWKLNAIHIQFQAINLQKNLFPVEAQEKSTMIKI